MKKKMINVKVYKEMAKKIHDDAKIHKKTRED